MPNVSFDETSDSLTLTLSFTSSVLKLNIGTEGKPNEARIDLARLSPEAWGKLVGADSVKTLNGKKTSTQRRDGTDVKCWRQVTDITRLDKAGKKDSGKTIESRLKAIECLYSGEVRTRGEGLSDAMQACRKASLKIVKAKRPKADLRDIPTSYTDIGVYLRAAGAPKDKTSTFLKRFEAIEADTDLSL